MTERKGGSELRVETPKETGRSIESRTLMEPHRLMVLTPPQRARWGRLKHLLPLRAPAPGRLEFSISNSPPIRPRLSQHLARSRDSRAVFRGFSFEPRRERISTLLSPSDKPERAILAGPDCDRDGRFCPANARSGIEVLREAISLKEAVAAVEIRVDGIILKGHEAGGRVGPRPSFVLIQKWRQYADRHRDHSAVLGPRRDRPEHRGGLPRGAARAGVVLDSQVLLARESPLSEAARRKVAGTRRQRNDRPRARGSARRTGSTPGPTAPAAQELAKEEERLLASDQPADAKLAAWQRGRSASDRARPGRRGLARRAGCGAAAGLAAQGVTVAGIVQTICERATRSSSHRRNASQHLVRRLAAREVARHEVPDPARADDRASATRPRSRDAVAAGGALPFLALALLRKAETETLLKETKAKLGTKPWGVGILGFVPNEIRTEQLEAIRSYKPPFAIIAGGRPDQARELEAQGIPTYLHVPSPGLLRMFLKDGARRFIFEGQECGGHVGPRTSFALWEAMVEVLLEHIGGEAGRRPARRLRRRHPRCALGEHGRRSERGAGGKGREGRRAARHRVPVHEGSGRGRRDHRAVPARSARAAARRCCWKPGPGHAIRCIPTPYADDFEAEKKRLRRGGQDRRWKSASRWSG